MRLCLSCDQWLKTKECPACGGETDACKPTCDHCEAVAMVIMDGQPLCVTCYDNAQVRAWERLYGSHQSRTVSE